MGGLGVWALGAQGLGIKGFRGLGGFEFRGLGFWLGVKGSLMIPLKRNPILIIKAPILGP